MDTQYIVLFVSFLLGLGLGAVIATLSKWGLSRYALELDYRLSDLESRLSSEVKKRANEKSISARNANTSLDEWAKQQTGTPQTGTPFATDFGRWQREKMSGKG